jgi:tetratricopeptide (TPR) repeat protein
MLWARKMETVAEGYDQTLMLTGHVYMKKGMASEAIRCFESALEINPRNAVSRLYLKRYKELGFATPTL